MKQSSKRDKPLESYSISFKEINELLYDYSSRLSDLDNNVLHSFFLRSLTPEYTANKVMELTSDINRSSNELVVSLDTQIVEAALERLWKKIISRRNFLIGVIKMLQILSRFVMPYLLDELTNNFKIPNGNQIVDVAWLGRGLAVETLSWIYAAILISILIFNVLLDTQFTWNVNRAKYEGMTVLQFLMYSKLVDGKFVETSKPHEDKQANINSLVTSDCEEFFLIFHNFHEAWGGVANLLLVMSVIFFKMKTAFPIAIVIACFLLWMITSRLTKKMAEVFPEVMRLRDKRITLTNDVVQGIKSIKYLCWESIFKGKIQELRNLEFSFLSKLKYVDCCYVIIWGATSISIITATFIAYSLIGYDLAKANIFTDLAYLQMLMTPLTVLPRNLGAISSSFIALRRIKAFLMKEEVPKLNVLNEESQSPESRKEENIVMLKARSMTWPQVDESIKGESFFELSNIDLKIKRGTLNMVIGNVSAGKTALLSAIMGEMKPLVVESTAESLQELEINNEKSEREILVNPRKQSFKTVTEDRVIVKGNIAYVSQNPWLLKQSIRENILFGKKYDPIFYRQCLEACDLIADIKKLPNRDHYDVGLNGSNLSGGQRQRISLCRALYQDADIYLLDDILSSDFLVDVSVAKILFKKAVIKLLVKRNKTIVLVLSQYKYLKHGDRVLLMKKGQLIEDPMAVQTFLEGVSPRKEEEDLGILSAQKSFSTSSDKSQGPFEFDANKEESFEEIEEPKKVETEKKELGGIKPKTVMLYINAMGSGVFFLIIFGGVLMQTTRVCFDFWLRDYIDAKAKGENPWFYVHSFEITLLILMFLSVISCAYRAWIFTYGNLKASRVIFNTLIPKVLDAHMTFFDVNPVGKIIQRFAEDSWSLDDRLAYKCNMLLNNIMNFAKITYVLAAKVPVILLLVLPVAIIFTILQDKFRKVARELKRMHSIYNSRLFTHLAETSSGVIVVRAFRKETLMAQSFLDKLTDLLTARSLMDTMRTWFIVRLKSLSMAVSSSVLIFALLYKYYLSTSNDYGDLALILFYALTSPLNFEDIMITVADAEKELIGIERINHYLEHKTELENEIEEAEKQELEASANAKAQISKHQKRKISNIELMANEPPKPIAEPFSAISFKGVSLKYSNGGQEHYALKNLNLTIKRHEKVALCGRTGSGKTTILNSLLRLYDIDNGEITFNGQNVKNIPKKELRSSIAVIPQFGLMYEATLRENLDPYDVVPKEKLQKALDKGNEFMRKAAAKHQETKGKKKKKDSINEHAELFKEDFRIEKNGSNLSNGEKQVINFLRILLQDSRVIFLDEATSNVDPITDELMHQALFEMCEDRTLIVITHRLEYLKHYDKIILLENGEIVDQGSFEELMSKPDGKFQAFVNEGDDHF